MQSIAAKSIDRNLRFDAYRIKIYRPYCRYENQLCITERWFPNSVAFFINGSKRCRFKFILVDSQDGEVIMQSCEKSFYFKQPYCAHSATARALMSTYTFEIGPKGVQNMCILAFKTTRESYSTQHTHTLQTEFYSNLCFSPHSNSSTFNSVDHAVLLDWCVRSPFPIYTYTFASGKQWFILWPQLIHLQQDARWLANTCKNQIFIDLCQSQF